MPGPEIAQYGIAFFTVAGLIYIMARYFNDRRSGDSLAEVVQNNTKALEQVVQVVQAIQIALARQETKIDELLERARR